MGPVSFLSLLLLFVFVVSASPAEAFSGGIFDQASQGCTCHGGVIAPNTTTQLLIEGLPTDEGYQGGQAYDIRVWVVGVSLPLIGAGATNLAGYNLETTGGNLQPLDPMSRSRLDRECTVMARETGCGSAANPCLVFDDPDCPEYRPDNPACRKCTAEDDPSQCRSCDQGIVISAQATHTAGAGSSPNPDLEPIFTPVTDGNSRFFWDLRWTAPAAGAGPVSFHLAGNVVNGNGTQDVGDRWSVGSPIVVVEEAAQ